MYRRFSLCDCYSCVYISTCCLYMVCTCVNILLNPICKWGVTFIHLCCQILGLPEFCQSTCWWWKYWTTYGGHLFSKELFKVYVSELYGRFKVWHYFFQKLLESRIELRSLLLTSHGRLKDLLFLDLALASAVRTSMERGFKDLNFAHPPVLAFSQPLHLLLDKLIFAFLCNKNFMLHFLMNEQEPMFFMSLVLESLCLSTVNNEDFIYCTKVYLSVICQCQRFINLFCWHQYGLRCSIYFAYWDIKS